MASETEVRLVTPRENLASSSASVMSRMLATVLVHVLDGDTEEARLDVELAQQRHAGRRHLIALLADVHLVDDLNRTPAKKHSARTFSTDANTTPMVHTCTQAHVCMCA